MRCERVGECQGTLKRTLGRRVDGPMPDVGSCSLVSCSALDVVANGPTVALGEESEFHGMGMGGLGLHPLAHHFALGIDDLTRAGKLKLKPHPPARAVGFQESREPHAVGADV